VIALDAGTAKVDLYPRVWLRLGAAAGGNWTPMQSYKWAAKPIPPCLGAHEPHPRLLCMGLFSKLNGCLAESPRPFGSGKP